MQIILATHNDDKAREFREILQSDEIEFISLNSMGERYEIDETGKTYTANADIKAREAYKRFKQPVLADDSGLSLDVLDGYPGIYSARFAGVDSTYPDKIAQLHKLLEAYPQEEWTASFYCALSYISEAGILYNYLGQVKGLIIPEMRGENGFGYDPVFYIPERGMTTAEMSPQEKHNLSHRGLALKAWFKDLKAGKLK